MEISNSVAIEWRFEFELFIEDPEVVWKQQRVGLTALPLPGYTVIPLCVRNSINRELTTSQGSFVGPPEYMEKCKRSHAQKDKYCVSPLIKAFVTANSQEQWRKEWLPGVYRWRK